jgi:hypothetical protein
MILPLPWVFAGIGVAMMATSVPLMLRRVPMNRWYGVRTRKAYASEEAWYEINAFGGRAARGAARAQPVFAPVS